MAKPVAVIIGIVLLAVGMLGFEPAVTTGGAYTRMYLADLGVVYALVTLIAPPVFSSARMAICSGSRRSTGRDGVAQVCDER